MLNSNTTLSFRTIGTPEPKTSIQCCFIPIIKGSRHRLPALATAAIALIVTVGSARSQTLVLDDFSSGFDNTVATTTQPTSCKTLSPTTPLGSSRSTTLNIGQNPYGLSSQMNIGNGHLIVDVGLNVEAAPQLVYGVDCINGTLPLALNLKPYGRFRINFLGLTGIYGLHFNIVVTQGNGLWSSAGQNLAPQAGSFSIDVPFSAFVGSAQPPDFSNIKAVSFHFTSASSNFGISSITAVY